MSKLEVGKNDLDTWCKQNQKSYLLEEWDYEKNISITPINVMPNSYKKAWWKCKDCGYEWCTSIRHRAIENTGCRECSKKIIGKKLKQNALLNTGCLQETKPELLDEWNYSKNTILPSEVTEGSNITVWWKCKQGHEWKARIGNRVYLDRGCPYCSGNKTLKGFNDLETWCKSNNREDLLKEWNYQKNEILPSQISPKNNKKVWWIDSLGHEWDASIGSRTDSKPGHPGGCPYCSNPPKRILIGFNDLETWCKNNHREDILDEWDTENNIVKSQEVTFGSGQKIWWKCNKNHRWKATINSRTVGKRRCPICTRTQTSYPEQAIAYYLSKKYDILQRFRVNNKEIDVYIPHYKIGIEYDGMIWHKSRESIDQLKTDILFDEGVTIIRLRETNDRIRKSHYDGKQYIIDFFCQNGKYCTDDFEWALRELFEIINKYTDQQTCPNINMEQDDYLIRAYYMNTLKSNSVASVFPELVSEWDYEKNQGVTPEAYSARNNAKVWWKCSNGHSWEASINTRTVRKLGCPYCAGQKVCVGKNDFKSWCLKNNSALLDEWDYQKNKVLPEEIPKTFKNKMWWKCFNGHSWEATVYNRVNGTGCPVCNNGSNSKQRGESLSEWCLLNKSTLCDEWDYDKNSITPEEVSYGSHKKVWWKCSKGHSWEAVIKSRTYKHGCPYCSGTNKKALVGVNDLKSWCEKNEKKYILDEWDYDNNGELTPEKVTYGSQKRITWKCSKGHSWEAKIKERTRVDGNQCPICRKL